MTPGDAQHQSKSDDILDDSNNSIKSGQEEGNIIRQSADNSDDVNSDQKKDAALE